MYAFQDNKKNFTPIEKFFLTTKLQLSDLSALKWFQVGDKDVGYIEQFCR